MTEALKLKFNNYYNQGAEYIFSAPGRTELGGNHTDHQHGRVLAGAVNLEMLAAVARNGSSTINVLSEGYPLCSVDLSALEKIPEEAGTSAALIRGIAAGFAARGFKLCGFNAYVSSGVLPGSGLSSSAAFEVLIGTIINRLCDGDLSPVQIAQIGQYAENLYFDKPCGLMDQTASAVGNIIAIDFEKPENPVVEPIDFDFSACGYALCIIDSGADHADLTDEYAAIPLELGRVSRFFGKDCLRDVSEELFYSKISELRAEAGDRALLRAMHIFDENRRVDEMVQALKSSDFAAFLSLVAQSGDSSWQYLQNVIPCGSSRHQELALVLALTKKLLAGKGACRVHGGGFAGAIQAFVPVDEVEQFKGKIETMLSKGCCHVLSIRDYGGLMLEEI